MKLFIFTSAITLSLMSSAYAANIEAGKALVEKNNCASCHGADLKSPIAPNYPKIAGQHQDYLFYSVDRPSIYCPDSVVAMCQV